MFGEYMQREFGLDWFIAPGGPRELGGKRRITPGQYERLKTAWAREFPASAAVDALNLPPSLLRQVNSATEVVRAREAAIRRLLRKKSRAD